MHNINAKTIHNLRYYQADQSVSRQCEIPRHDINTDMTFTFHGWFVALLHMFSLTHITPVGTSVMLAVGIAM